MTNNELIIKAINASKNAYAPYSGYQVGAVLITDNGTIYTGCNIENSSFSATICAERTAISKAISEGDIHFSKIIIAATKNGNIDKNCVPCGVCCQVLSEFCNDNFCILIAQSESEYRSYTLSQLLPTRFTKQNIV